MCTRFKGCTISYYAVGLDGVDWCWWWWRNALVVDAYDGDVGEEGEVAHGMAACVVEEAVEGTDVIVVDSIEGEFDG